MYGAPLRFPGKFFVNEDVQSDPQVFIEHLRQHIRRIRPSPTAHHVRPKTFTLKDLQSCTHVFIRIDSTKKPLDLPYEGPYEILERISDKVFKVKIKGEPINISSERLKPAYLEDIPDDCYRTNTSVKDLPGSQEDQECQIHDLSI